MMANMGYKQYVWTDAIDHDLARHLITEKLASGWSRLDDLQVARSVKYDHGFYTTSHNGNVGSTLYIIRVYAILWKVEKRQLWVQPFEWLKLPNYVGLENIHPGEYYCENDELPNPRPTQRKKNQAKKRRLVHFSPNSKLIFRGVGISYTGNRLLIQETQLNQNSPQKNYLKKNYW